MPSTTKKSPSTTNKKKKPASSKSKGTKKTLLKQDVMLMDLTYIMLAMQRQEAMNY